MWAYEKGDLSKLGMGLSKVPAAPSDNKILWSFPAGLRPTCFPYPYDSGFSTSEPQIANNIRAANYQ